MHAPLACAIGVDVSRLINNRAGHSREDGIWVFMVFSVLLILGPVDEKVLSGLRGGQGAFHAGGFGQKVDLLLVGGLDAPASLGGEGIAQHTLELGLRGEAQLPVQGRAGQCRADGGGPGVFFGVVGKQRAAGLAVFRQRDLHLLPARGHVPGR